MSTNRPLCERPGCTSRGYHWPTCAEADCAGCQPRLAVDGLRLCRRDLDGIALDAIAAADLYDELALALAGSGAPGEKVSRSGDRSKVVNDAVAEARTVIRHTLVAMCKMIAEERGFSLPQDTVRAMGEYVARFNEWLAAHEAAAEHSDELRELAHGRPYRLAYPSGTRRFQVKLDGEPVPCREQVEETPCPGTLWTVLRRTDSLLPSALVCDVDENHTIPASEWLTLGRKLRRAA